MATYLVTGAAGHLGRTLVNGLLEQGAQVRALVLPDEPNAKLEGAQVIKGDVLDLKSLDAFMAVPGERILIHAAGIVSIASKYDQKVYDVNVTGTKNVLRAAMGNHVDRLVHVSSVHAIPEKPKGEVMREVDHFDPNEVVGLYAKTKAEATQAVLDAAKRGLNATVVHPSGILGPGDYGHGHLTQLVIDYLKGKLFAAVNGGYDVVDVRDVAAGILLACEKGRKGECYILSGGYHTIRELLDTLSRASGKPPIKTYLPTWLAKLTAPLSEVYYALKKQPPLYTRYSMQTVQANALFSHEKATQELGYETRPLETTLRDTVSWLKAHGRV